MNANLEALTMLLRLFRDLSTEPVTDEVEFAREVGIRWKLWREQEGWLLQAGGLMDGYFEIHLRESVLNVRLFKNGTGEAPCIVSIRILFGDVGMEVAALRFSEDPDAQLVQAKLLELISFHPCLYPLELSMSRALARYYQPSGLVTI